MDVIINLQLFAEEKTEKSYTKEKKGRAGKG